MRFSVPNTALTFADEFAHARGLAVVVPDLEGVETGVLLVNMADCEAKDAVHVTLGHHAVAVTRKSYF